MELSNVFEQSIVNKGNIKRIASAMNKAMNKEEITIGFIGGSITMGALSSTPKLCYAYLVYEWWVNKFAECKVNYINAGIGATTSQFGVARVEEDLLCYKPDFVLVEFSVNDIGNDLFKETYEGLIRRILLYDNAPGVMILNNVQYNDGINAQQVHNEIGKAYEFPIVSMKQGIYPYIESDEIDKKELTSDDLHPNDKGHSLVSKVVIHMLELIYSRVLSGDVDDEYTPLSIPVTKNRYMDSIRYNNKKSNPILNGFKIDISGQDYITQVFKNGWSSTKVGDSISFQIVGAIISIQYKKTIKKDAPIAIAILDGDDKNPVVLDANFEETWGDCLYLQDLIIMDEIKEHNLEIKIIKSSANEEVEFYLASVIVANREC